MSETCDICGKVVRSSSSLSMHKHYAHNINTAQSQETECHRCKKQIDGDFVRHKGNIYCWNCLEKDIEKAHKGETFKCDDCGTEVKSGSKFCQDCGTEYEYNSE